MKLFISIITLSTICNLPLQATENHLSIKIPDLQSSNFFGPVKKVITEYSYDMSDRKYKEIRLYDEMGNLESRSKYNSKNKLTFFATNTYDSAGCFIHQRVEDIRKKTTNDYEIVLNIPAQKIAYIDKTADEVEVLKFDTNRFHISTTIRKRGKKTRIYDTSKRNPEGQTQVFTKYNDKRRVKYTVAYEWNENKLKSRSLITDNDDDTKVMNVYEYLSLDQHGNWTQSLLKCLDMKNDKQKKYEKFSTRIIEYYEE